MQAPVADHSSNNQYTALGGSTLHINNGHTFISSTSLAAKERRPHRRCPAPSINYVPRSGLEKRLDAYFFPLRGRKQFVLYGLGGCGKTQGALAFADQRFYRIQEDGDDDFRFSEIYWIDATNAQTLLESLQDIAQSVGVNTEDVLIWLANRRGKDRNWLMIFNNADDPTLDLYPYFPDCSHGNILITTRNREAARLYGAGAGSDYGLGGMTPEESRELLLRHARIEPQHLTPHDAKDVDELVKELYHFPLSVTQAGAYIARQHSTPKKYLTKFRSRREDVIREQGQMKNPDRYEHSSVQTAWLISFDKLNVQLKRLLWFCSFLHFDDIRQTVFEYMCTNLDEYETYYKELLAEDKRIAIAKLKEFREGFLERGQWSDSQFQEVIGELQSYSLILFVALRATWSIHPLVQELAQNTLDPDAKTATRNQVLLILATSRGETTEERAFEGSLALRVDAVLKGIRLEFNGCQSEFAEIYGAARRWDEQLDYSIAYKEVCERVFGGEDEKTLGAIANLATTYHEQGRLDDATRLDLQVMEVRKRKQGEDHLDTLKVISNLGMTYHEQGRLDDAARLKLQVMEVRKRKLGEDHLDTLKAIANLATTYRKQGRLDDAEAFEIQVVEGRTKELGFEHAATQEVIHNLELARQALERRLQQTSNHKHSFSFPRSSSSPQPRTNPAPSERSIGSGRSHSTNRGRFSPYDARLRRQNRRDN